MKIELYIDKQLCDISDPDKFSVYLKRQLYNPTELNTKDAQASYSITLPASTTNNRIFGFANVEEVRGKFGHLYDAELIVNGIKILVGKFRLNEINRDSYKGNLGIPAPITVKEIFKDKYMNQLDEWIIKIDNTKGLDFITQINKKDTPPCIFPFVLYGLMPRDPNVPPMYKGELQTEDFEALYKERYKYIYDENVRLGIEDIPASVNCLQMLKQIFENEKYELGGSAFSDERLKNLYVSYKNPNDYPQGWNWGDLGEMKIKGSWRTAYTENGRDYNNFERQFIKNSDDYGEYFNINLFDSNNLVIDDIQDNGTNVTYAQYKDKYTDDKGHHLQRKKLNIHIPKSGYYKVHLYCHDLQLNTVSSQYEFPDNGLIFASTYQANERHNDFRRSRYELQLMRDYGESDFNNVNIVGLYNNPQFPQTHYENRDKAVKYYPFQNEALVVDPAVNQNFICGLRWGSHQDGGEWNGKDEYENNNVSSSDYLVYASPNYMFIANGFSWDKTFSQKKKILCAYDSSAYGVYENIDAESYVRLENNYHKYGVEDIVDKEIEGSEEDENGKKPTEVKITYKWDEDIKIRHGMFEDYPPRDTNDSNKFKPINRVRNGGDGMQYVKGNGTVECIIWLEKGEQLALCLAGDMADRRGGKKRWDECIAIINNLEFSLHIEPFRSDIEWNNFDSQGNAMTNINEQLKWYPEKEENGEDKVDPGFRKGSINLIEFLPSNVKADEWIEHFCKAFNLALVNTGERRFELNVKQADLPSDVNRLIDIDNRAHVVHHSNQPLSLPRVYKLGFTNSTDEEGYYRSERTNREKPHIPIETGGGEFYTGSIDTNTIEQTSNFSYCWYRQLYRVDKKEEEDERYKDKHIIPLIKVPIITDHEIWDWADDYKEMVSKQYFDKSQRFWFKTGTRRFPLGMQGIKKEEKEEKQTRALDNPLPRKHAEIAVVSNSFKKLDEELDEELDGELELSYENKPNTLLNKYFFLLDNNTNYTEIECYLTPEEYEKINLCLVKFNGDLYNVASVDGYDPMCRKPAKLQLIPKIK